MLYFQKLNFWLVVILCGFGLIISSPIMARENAAIASQSSQSEAQSHRRMLKLADGESLSAFGVEIHAQTPTVAVLSLSTEMVTIAVVSGQLAIGATRARAGEALVTPIDGSQTHLFGYDAERLAASLPPAWAQEMTAPLQQLALRQKRLKFWGLIEPVRINATSPSAPNVEIVRQSYLGNETIIGLRRAAHGQPQALAGLTVKKFAESLAAGDATSVAHLLDPKPFTDSGADEASWQAARLGFAQNLVKDAVLRHAMAALPDANATSGNSFEAGGAYRIQLVMRDRAMFVSAVEPIQ